MAKNEVNFPCPNCKERHFITFAKIKKNQKSGENITFPNRCSLTPNEVLDELRKPLIAFLGGDKTAFGK